MGLHRFDGTILILTVFLVLLAGCGPSYMTQPFNGRNLDGWKVKGDESGSKWTVGVAD